MEYNEIESFLRMIDRELMNNYKRAGIIKFIKRETGLSFRTFSLIVSGEFREMGRRLLFGTRLALENFIKNYTSDNVDMSILEGHERKKD